MKQYSIQIAGIIGICFLMQTACSSESPADNTSEGNELVVSAEIIPSGESKAVGAATNGTDKLSFVKEDQILITRSGKSKAYKLSDKNQWLPQTDGENLAADGTEQTYTASFPHDFANIQEGQNEAAASGALSNYEKSNKLISEVTTASNYVPFKFSHAFSKITVIVAYKNKRKNVSAKLVGKNIRTSEAAATTDETIKMLRTSPTGETASVNHTFICILNPGTSRGFTLTVSGQEENGTAVADEIYTQKGKEFKAGFNYVYNFSSNDNLILTGVTVVDFDSAGDDYNAGNAT